MGYLTNLWYVSLSLTIAFTQVLYKCISKSQSSIHTDVFFLSFRYNKREFDFPSLRDYNDYLEQVEEIGENTYCQRLRNM